MSTKAAPRVTEPTEYDISRRNVHMKRSDHLKGKTAEKVEKNQESEKYLKTFMDVYHNSPEVDVEIEKKLGENFQFKQIIVTQKILYNNLFNKMDKVKTEVCCLKVCFIVSLLAAILISSLVIYLKIQGII